MRTRVPPAVAGLSAFLLGVIVSGCGAAGSPTAPPAAATAAATPSAGPVVTPAPTPVVTAPPATASTSEPCSLEAAPVCEMQGGDYHAPLVDGGISFRLIDGTWQLVAYQKEILSLRSGNNWIGFLSGNVQVFRPGGPKVVKDAVTAQDAMSILPGFKVTPVDGVVSIDGHDAVAFDVENTADASITVLAIEMSSARYGLDPGAVVRFYWVQGDAGTFLVAIEAPKDTFAQSVGAAAPMLATIRFD